MKSTQKIIFFLMVWVFYSLNSQYLQIPMASILRWLLLAVLVMTVTSENNGRIMKPPSLIAFYLLAVIPSVFVSVDQIESIVKILSFIVVIWGSYIYFSSYESADELEGAIKIITIVMIAFELQSILCILLGVGYSGDRATGITTNANTLGIYSNMALLSAYYWCNNSGGIKKIFFIIIMAASAATAIASGSRTAFLTLALNLAILLLMQFRTGIMKLVIIILIALVGYLMLNGKLVFLNIPALDRITSEGGLTRGELWDKGIEVWKTHPFFGCGYAVSQIYNDLPGLEHYPFHNSYLTVLAEIGVWGVGVLGGSMLFNLGNLLKMFWVEMRVKKVSLFMMCCMILIELMIAAYSESFLFAVGSTEACTFWLLFTWGMVYIQKKMMEM